MPPRTTKRRTTTNIKTKNTWNCQKIELYGSLTTKLLKKKHSFKLLGGAGMGSQGWGRREDTQQCSVGRPGPTRWWLADWLVPRLHARQTTQPRVPAREKKALKLMTTKTCGDCGGRSNSQPHRRVGWRDPQSPRMYTNPLGNQHQKGPICLWVMEEVTGSRARANKQH